MKKLLLRDGSETLVDDDVYEWAQHHKWYRSPAGYAIRNGGYGRKGRFSISLHKEIMGQVPKGCDTDHINRNPLDNRRENLRFVSRSINNLNSSARRNVERHQGAWMVRFGIGDGKQIRVSGIKTEEEARSIAALLRGALIYHELTKGDSRAE